MSTVDRAWQTMSKARRAAVYRAIGRAAKNARNLGDPGVADDLRVVMNVLRAHAKAPKKRATAKKK